jgi:putative glutamine amidotransferase
MDTEVSKRALVIYRKADRVLPYQQALVAAGVDPVLSGANFPVTLDGFDGLVLTGGSDVDPALYGEPRGTHTDEPDHERDRIEFELLRQALTLDLPVLAICRGLQIVNVFHGGSLHQHLEPPERHQRVAGKKSEPIHTVAVESDSLLSRIAQSEVLQVNSRHHQGIARLGEGLRVTARAPDGVVEAVERPDKRFFVAVQWHPEDQVSRFPEQLSLFAHFREACALAKHSA